MRKRVPLWFWELGKKKGKWGQFVGWDLKMKGNGGNSDGWFGKGIGFPSMAAVFFCRDNQVWVFFSQPRQMALPFLYFFYFAPYVSRVNLYLQVKCCYVFKLVPQLFYFPFFLILIFLFFLYFFENKQYQRRLNEENQ